VASGKSTRRIPIISVNFRHYASGAATKRHARGFGRRPARAQRNGGPGHGSRHRLATATSCSETRWHKRRIAQYSLQRGCTDGKSPIETGKNAGQRAFAAKCGKSRQIAVCTDPDLGRIQDGNDARQQWPGDPPRRRVARPDQTGDQSWSRIVASRSAVAFRPTCGSRNNASQESTEPSPRVRPARCVRLPSSTAAS
jgi:hypothetical protein